MKLALVLNTYSELLEEWPNITLKDVVVAGSSKPRDAFARAVHNLGLVKAVLTPTVRAAILNEFPPKPVPKKEVAAHPLVPTGVPNGQPVQPGRYYAYLFVPAPDLDGHLKSVTDSLTGPHPNVGDLWLRIGVKLIGVQGIKEFAVGWQSDDGECRLKVRLDRGWTELGFLRPTQEFTDWRPMPGWPQGTTVIHHNPPPRPVEQPPPAHDPSVVPIPARKKELPPAPPLAPKGNKPKPIPVPAKKSKKKGAKK